MDQLLPLAGQIAARLIARKETIAVAESSTGGLIAAAHASCYSMALSHALAGNGTPATSIDTVAVVGFQPGVGITGSDLTVKAKVPGLTEDEFKTFAEGAKTGCPVSAALAAIPITLTTEFVA